MKGELFPLDKFLNWVLSRFIISSLNLSIFEQKFLLGLGRASEGYSQKNWVGVCGPLPKTLSLFMTKICDIPYPSYDLTKNLTPYLRPDP